MKNSLTPSVPAPTEEQIEKLCAKVRAAARKSRLTSQHFQNGLGYPGTGLEDEILATVVRFAKRVSGIFTPLPAQETGLVPEGWDVVSDNLETEIDVTMLDFTSRPLQEDEEWIGIVTMIERIGNAYGSLGFAKLMLDAQEEGRDIIPVKRRGLVYILPRTILRDRMGARGVGFLGWDLLWALDFTSLHSSWRDYNFHRNARFVRPRKPTLPVGR